MLHLVSALAIVATPFSPASISYATLRNGSPAALADALSSTGMIQINDIPGFAAGRKAVLKHAAECAHWDQEHTFEDGTTRRTMAAHTIAGPGGAQPFASVTPSASVACKSFQHEAEPFRMAVDAATRLFARRVSALLHLETPLLTARDDPFSFDDLFAVVDNGVHLEHIHAYTPPASTAAAPPAGATLEMHTDQGLFIAFTPALIASTPSSAVDDPSIFHVTLSDGTLARAVFESDALVFMVGAGLAQLVAARSPPATPANTLVPRAMPHALTVAAAGGAPSAPRMWYGRMVLPPAGATVPGTHATYGEVRSAMNDDAHNTDDAMAAASSSLVSIGCGAGAAETKDHSLEELHRRLLSEPASCNNGTGLLCWHRCMPLSAGDSLGSSAVGCAASNLQTQCVNSRDQLHSGGHGDYYPACTNTTQAETPYPSLPFAPRASSCASEGAFLEYADAANADNTYDHAVNLTAMCGAISFGPAATPGTPCVRGRLLWRVAGGMVHMKMIVNGLFGWLAVGLANPGGGHNGMNGGRIVMALPATPTTYSAATGLAVAGSPTPSVDEYIINENGGSAFRLWQTPYGGEGVPTLTAASTEVSDCYTSMAFATNSIGGWSLNLTGTDDLIWGLNDMDAYVGYHHNHNRGLLTVQWDQPADAALTTEVIIIIAAAGAAAVAGLLSMIILVGCLLRRKGTPAPSPARKADDIQAADIQVTTMGAA